MVRFVRISLIIVFCSVSVIQAQNIPVHEQYMFDWMLVNPSFAGFSEITNVKVVHREQWV